MPINPNIALQVKTPEAPNLLQQYGQVAQIKNMQAQAQLIPEQLKAAQLENEQKTISLQQTKALNDAYRSSLVVNPDGSNDIDTGRLSQAVAASGFGSALPGVLEGVTKYKKGIVDLKDAQAKVFEAHANNGGAMGAAVKAAGYDPNLFITLTQHGIQEGAIDPKGAAPVVDAVTKALASDPTGESARQIVRQTADTWLAQSPKQAELANSTASAAAATSRATSAAAAEARAAGLAPTETRIKTAAATSAEAKATLDAAKANLVQHPEQYAQIVDALFPNDKTGLAGRTKSQVQFYISKGQVEEANRALDKAVEDANAPAKAAAVQAAEAPGKIATATAEAMARSPIETQTAVNTERAKQRINAGGTLAQLGPAQRSIAQKLAEGDFNPAELGRFPDKEALLAGAMEINPDWTRQAYATKKAFTDPQSRQSQNLGTVSRIVEHIGRFDKNSEALGFSPSMLTGTNLTGPAAALHQDAHAISSELEKLVSGGVGTEGQVKSWQSALTSSRADIRKAAIDEISQLAAGQFIGMNQTYKAALGKDLPLDKFTSQDSRAWLQKNGIDVTGGAAAKPTGGAAKIASKAEYDALPKGAQYIDADGQTYTKK